MDGRNWIRGEPAFTSIIALRFVLPDETDLLELGVRPALAYVEDAVRPLDRGGLLVYRRGS
jgi:hypothetical protein